MDKEQFDFLYAVKNTRIVVKPSGTLETFGTTMLRYHLITELMDSVGKIRVREGSVTAARPQIMTPSMMNDMLEGFGEDAHEYVEWLRQNEGHLQIMQYGFVITKTEATEHIVTQSLEAVVDDVSERVRVRKDALASVVVGVDHPWEVCLLKMLRDITAQSAQGNFRDIARAEQERHSALRADIERDFIAASTDKSKLQALGERLRALDLFDEYEDRFFALVKAQQ